MSELSLNPGSIIEEEALVLGSIVYKEKDKIVTLLTPHFGRIRVFARSAVRSRKRFGACLDAGQVIRAQLKVPRDHLGSMQAELPLWTLESADLKELFLQWRSNYSALESLFFILRFVQDIVPDGHSDASYFHGVISYLKVDPDKKFFQNSAWFKIAFWSWATTFLGFGTIGKTLLPSLWATHEKWIDLWRETVLQRTPNVDRLILAFEKLDLPALNLKQEVEVYEEWLALTGMRWEYFEKWLSR